MLFSIIIPTYNREKYILTAINSVVAQTYGNLELIVVDDGSTDNTQKIVSTISDSRIHYIKINNSERAVARNTGIKLAKGDYITFLDSDDMYYPNYLKNAAESLATFKLPAFFHLAYEIKNNKGNNTIKIKPIVDNDYKCLVKPNVLSCMGIFIRKDITRNYLFNEDRNLSGTEDWELWMRIIAKYGIRTDNRISSVLIDHNTRSMNEVNPQKIIKRVKLSIIYSFRDKQVAKLYKPYKTKIIANSYCYIALHLCLGKHKKLALNYLLKSIVLKPFIIFDIRFLATIKRLL